MHNPVAWQLWDQKAVELAKKYNRLIFLSIGYSACHCRLPSAHHSLGLSVRITETDDQIRVPCDGKGVLHVSRGRLDLERIVHPD